LRDTDNSFIFPYDEIDDKMPGATFFDLPKWFEQAGYKKVFDNTIKRLFYHASARRIEKLNNYYDKGYRVITLIDVSIITDKFESLLPFKNHWIVWDGKVTDDNGNPITSKTSDDTKVKLNAFSWGRVGNFIQSDITFDKFLRHTFGALVFSKDKL